MIQQQFRSPPAGIDPREHWLVMVFWISLSQGTKEESAMPTSGSSRRAFIKTMGAAAAATCGAAAAAKAQDYKPQEQKRLTQAAARYQDHPKDNESCGNCPYFALPNSCVVVEGEISA